MLWGILWGVSINLSVVQYRSHNNPKGRNRFCRKGLIHLERYQAIRVKNEGP
jgi:hypothetical protein